MNYEKKLFEFRAVTNFWWQYMDTEIRTPPNVYLCGITEEETPEGIQPRAVLGFDFGKKFQNDSAGDYLDPHILWARFEDLRLLLRANKTLKILRFKAEEHPSGFAVRITIPEVPPG